MINETILGVALITNVLLSPAPVRSHSAVLAGQNIVLASHELDLTTRLPDPAGSEIFADNILLSLHYGKGDTNEMFDSSRINWDKAHSPFEFSFTLKPNETFAFHNNVLPEYKNSIVKTLNSKFFMEEGYKSLAGLGGNGVCHLATLMNWVAKDAGLEVTAKVNHDFYIVPGIAREYGTAIFYAEGGNGNSQNQNLYIKNNFDIPVVFNFKADNKEVILTISI